MFFKQFFDSKLAQTSYMIGCQKTNEAMIIDPKRVLDEYIEVAEQEGFKITKATETHIHADFASGLRDVGRKLGAQLFVSDEGDDNWKYVNMPSDTVFLKDEDIINIGFVELKVVHTPGHTPESISFVLTDHGGGSTEPMGMFTGDFLFVGDVGRPDLLEVAADIKGTTEIGGNNMFDSLQKLSQYPDFLQIWPGHGAGSACGKSLGAVPLSTLGYERKNNWALQYGENEKSAFIDELTKDQPEPPTYFSEMKRVNKVGLEEFNLKDIKVDVTNKFIGQLFDLREKEDFRDGFSKGAINVPYNDQFIQFIGWYIDFKQPMTVIVDPIKSEQLQKDLASIGYDGLELIIPSDEVSSLVDDSYETISPEKFVQSHLNDSILDVRTSKEYNVEHLDSVEHIHFGTLRTADVPFEKDKQLFVHCQSGVRSAMAVSILKVRGFTNVINVDKGFIGIKGNMN